MQHLTNLGNANLLPVPSNPTSGASSEEDLLPFPEPEHSSIILENKPGANLHYTYFAPSPSRPTRPNPFARSLVVFLNGLLKPRNSWDAAITTFLEKRINNQLPYPALLSYDRYGQGDSDRDPDDKDPPPSHGHDALSAVSALHDLIQQIWRQRLNTASPTQAPVLIFVCNSIGCAFARLFAQQYPGTVCGLLFLDSIIANSDLVTQWPDPDAPDFDPHALPPGVSEKDARNARDQHRILFHPAVPSNEGLSRRNLADLLPHAHGPRLHGYGNTPPYLTVVGHDWETFAEQSYTGRMAVPKLLTMTYTNPTWQRYNEGLVRITDPEKAIGPLIAVGCGHFIQCDGPGFVSDELISLLDRVVNRVEQVWEGDGR